MTIQKTKRARSLGAWALLGATASLQGQALLKHDFNDGTLGPFEPSATGNGNSASVVNNRLETDWSENNYSGAGWTRKAEIKTSVEYHTNREAWVGFKIKLHSNYMQNNDNTDASLMQIFGFDDAQSRFGPTGMIKYDSNVGALTWFHWTDDTQSTKKNHLIVDNFPKNTYVDVILHFILGKNNNGTVEIWTDGVRRLRLTGQNLGWGDIDGSGNQYNESYTEFVFGQYNYRSGAANDDTYYANGHSYDGFVNGESRTVTYDDISIWNGSNGYSIVDPDGGIPNDRIVSLKKVSNTSKAMDGNSGSSNYKKVHIWNYSSSNNNQKWVEVDRGGGYYSYKKYGTNFCLDGNNGANNGKICYLYSQSSTNANQQWKREAVDTRAHTYVLRKKNYENYALDGSASSADNGTQLKLWGTNFNNTNQQWEFVDRGSN